MEQSCVDNNYDVLTYLQMYLLRETLKLSSNSAVKFKGQVVFYNHSNRCSVLPTTDNRRRPENVLFALV